MARFALLSEKQLAVLRWVGDGRPKGVYENGFEHRITARALERRGLLVVRGHGSSWRASLTDDGQYYLTNAAYPPSDEPEPPKPPRVRQRPTPPEPYPITDLLGRLAAAGGVLRLDQPSDLDRISYRHAVEQARATGALPTHQRLKLTGIKHGSLLVELVQVAEPEAPGEQIPVPDEPDPTRPEIRALRDLPSLLAVSEEARSRTLALVQAMSDECSRRGWSLSVDTTPSFLVAIEQDSYRFVLSEEREKRDVFTDDDLAARKYDWQRVSPTRKEVWSGRLRLDLGPTYNQRHWADRKRWTLASRLPAVFDVLDELSGTARAHRARLAEQHRHDVQEWEAAVPRARDRYLHRLNIERARAQAAAWNDAQALQRYAEAVLERAQHLEGEQRDQAATWASWLQEEVARRDPLLDEAVLQLEHPEELGPKELDEFMPHRWTVRHPPEPPAGLRS